MRDLYITNSLSRKKEIFKPINEGHVGLYVCGPTVYGDAHLGHARPGVTYDVFVKLLKHLGYKVRYVRNITDVGHLEHDADEGDSGEHTAGCSPCRGSCSCRTSPAVGPRSICRFASRYSDYSDSK